MSSSNINPEIQKKFAEELAKETRNSTGSFVSDMQNLSTATCSVEDSFSDIGKGLERIISTSAIADNFKKTVTGLLATWGSHRNTYSKLLWRSREVAGLVEADATDFTENLIGWLKMDNYSVESKRKALPAQIKKIGQKTEQSQDLATGFDQLKKDVGAFQQNWADNVARGNEMINQEDQQDTERITRELSDLVQQLKAKTDELDSKTKQFAAVHSNIPVTGGVGGIISLLPKLLPNPSINVFIKVFDTVANIFSNGTTLDIKPLADELKNLQQQVETKRAEKAQNNTQDRDAINSLQANLTNFNADFFDVVCRLSLLSSVGYAMAQDLTEVHDLLAEVSDANIKETAFFEKLESMSMMYDALMACLAAYQISVIPKMPKISI